MARSFTDERGRYRIYGLPPGEYIVDAAPGGIGGTISIEETTEAEVQAALRELHPGTPTTRPASAMPDQLGRSLVTRTQRYFPSAPDRGGAQTLSLLAGEERLGVDITVPVVPAVKFEGLSVWPGAGASQNLSVVVFNESENACFSGNGLLRLDADGRFSSVGIPPGRYVLSGHATMSAETAANAHPFWAQSDYRQHDAGGAQFTQRRLWLESFQGALATGSHHVVSFSRVRFRL